MLRAIDLAFFLLASQPIDVQLLLPRPELRTLQDCKVCPELVTLPDGSYMGRAPVTVEEFAAFVEETGYVNRGWGCKWDFPGFPQGPRHPVTCITFQGAEAYVGWLSEKTGETYRLPTSDELFYAVTAFETTNYWWGQQIGRDRANCLGCGRDINAIGTTDVETYPPNPFNLLDALGNVWIWTSDCSDTTCTERALMSGGWSSPPSDLRMTKKIFNEPTIPFNTYGIRVMREYREE